MTTTGKVLSLIDCDLLNDLSYKSSLGKSLKNTLRKFDKNELLRQQPTTKVMGL